MKNLAYLTSKKLSSKEVNIFQERDFIQKLNHLDQIWKCLKNKYGDILAVKDLRGKNKEEFTYSELDQLITKASNAFFNIGLRKGEVVTIISENSPRWLIADQAIMRLSAIDAVRGINAPSVELAYIIKHSKSVGLIIQSNSIWEKLDNKEELLRDLKFIINFEDCSDNGILSWQQFLEFGNKISSVSYKAEVDKSSINDVATILYTSGTTGKPKGSFDQFLN